MCRIFLALVLVTLMQIVVNGQDPSSISAEDSEMFENARDVIRAGTLYVDVMQLVASRRFVELADKLAAGMKRHPAALKEQLKEARAGGPLPYDERFGLTKEEHDEYHANEKKFDVAKTSTAQIEITRVRENVFRLDGGTQLPLLTGVEIDFENDLVRSPIGVMKGGSELHAAENTALGTCDAWIWKFEEFETNEDKLPISGASVELMIGKLAKSGRYAMHYEIRQLSASGYKNPFYILEFDHPSSQPKRLQPAAVARGRHGMVSESISKKFPGRYVSIEILGERGGEVLRGLSRLLCDCADATEQRFYRLKSSNNSIRGEIAVVNDFDLFCERVEALDFVTMVDRDAERMWLSLEIDWDLVADAAPKRSQHERITSAMSNARKELPPVDSPDYFPELVLRLTHGDHFVQLEAGETLLEFNADKLPSKEIRRKVARGFLALADEQLPTAKELGIRGMVHFGGKHSVKKLIQILNTTELEASPLIYETLAKYPSSEAAEAVAGRLGVIFDRDLPIDTLVQMKEFAEPAALEALFTFDSSRALAAIKVLDKIGTKKSEAVLRKAMKLGDSRVTEAAAKAVLAIHDRSRLPEALTK